MTFPSERWHTLFLTDGTVTTAESYTTREEAERRGQEHVARCRRFMARHLAGSLRAMVVDDDDSSDEIVSLAERLPVYGYKIERCDEYKPERCTACYESYVLYAGVTHPEYHAA